jgi:hypothetical protein
VTATDAKPETGGPWEKVDIAGGVRWVMTDNDLPPSAKVGEIFYVIQSARAGGKGALYYWDNAATQWMPLGGSGGAPLDLGAGKEMVSVGVPVGSVMAWMSAVAPRGWFICDGSTFAAGSYPELATVLGNTTLPDLRGKFLRGYSVDSTVDPDGPRVPGSAQDWATGKPRNDFQWEVGNNSNPFHTHNTDSGWAGGYEIITNYAGDQINWAGGDPETRPTNVAVAYIIKAFDAAITVRN